MPSRKRISTKDELARRIMARKADMDREVGAAREQCQRDCQDIEARHMEGLIPLLREYITLEAGNVRLQ